MHEQNNEFCIIDLKSEKLLIKYTVFTKHRHLGQNFKIMRLTDYEKQVIEINHNGSLKGKKVSWL